jgi:hypothetical protein
MGEKPEKETCFRPQNIPLMQCKVPANPPENREIHITSLKTA